LDFECCLLLLFGFHAARRAARGMLAWYADDDDCQGVSAVSVCVCLCLLAGRERGQLQKGSTMSERWRRAVGQRASSSSSGFSFRRHRPRSVHSKNPLSRKNLVTTTLPEQTQLQCHVRNPKRFRKTEAQQLKPPSSFGSPFLLPSRAPKAHHHPLGSPDSCRLPACRERSGADRDPRGAEREKREVASLSSVLSLISASARAPLLLFSTPDTSATDGTRCNRRAKPLPTGPKKNNNNMGEGEGEPAESATTPSSKAPPRRPPF
jgi:hypothetical protein